MITDSELEYKQWLRDMRALADLHPLALIGVMASIDARVHQWLAGLNYHVEPPGFISDAMKLRAIAEASKIARGMFGVELDWLSAIESADHGVTVGDNLLEQLGLAPRGGHAVDIVVSVGLSAQTCLVLACSGGSAGFVITTAEGGDVGVYGSGEVVAASGMTGAGVVGDLQLGISEAGLDGYREWSTVLRWCGSARGYVGCGGGVVNASYKGVELQLGRGGYQVALLNKLLIPPPIGVQGGESYSYVCSIRTGC
jgi:hypothetical protein